MSTKEQISSILNDPDVSDEIKAMGQQILEEEFKRKISLLEKENQIYKMINQVLV